MFRVSAHDQDQNPGPGPTSCTKGTFHQGDIMQFGENAGAQYTAISLAFVAHARLKKIDQWQPSNVDDILRTGNALYKKMNITSVPVVMVWDRNGTLIQQFDDEYVSEKLGRSFTYDDVRGVVDQALGIQSKE